MQQIIKIEQPTIGQNFGSVTINNYYPLPVADPKHEDPVSNQPSVIPPDFFCVSSRFSEENIRERLNAELSLATTKIDYCRALYRLQHIGCINLNQYAHKANATGKVYQEDIEQLKKQHEEIWEVMNSVLMRLSNI